VRNISPGVCFAWHWWLAPISSWYYYWACSAVRHGRFFWRGRSSLARGVCTIRFTCERGYACLDLTNRHAYGSRCALRRTASAARVIVQRATRLCYAVSRWARDAALAAGRATNHRQSDATLCLSAACTTALILSCPPFCTTTVPSTLWHFALLFLLLLPGAVTTCVDVPFLTHLTVP